MIESSRLAVAFVGLLIAVVTLYVAISLAIGDFTAENKPLVLGGFSAVALFGVLLFGTGLFYPFRR